MKKLFICFLLVFFQKTFSQTGPAGVGTSSTNVFWIKADVGPSSTVNGSAISAWNDQSGNSLNVTQTVAAQQPTFVTNVINGFPAIQFDNVNSAGQNDKMIGVDSPILDNTAGYSFFIVTRPQNLDGNARVIVSKRTTVSVDQSFMLFYYTGNKIHTDIQTVDDRFATVTTFSNNINYLFDVVYDGSLGTGSRVAVYLEESLDRTAAETASFVPDNASPIILGTTDATDPRPYGGYISEVIIYREALVPARRIIVNNYLSAKYNISLSANDKYAGDTGPNGNYDFEVAGVGMESTGSNTSFSTSVSGGIGISVVSGFDNGDYILAGHAMMSNGQTTADVGGMTGVNNARWSRIWYVDVTNTLTVMSANIVFDLSDGGAPATPSVAANYVLLYRSSLTGNWTELTTASSISGDRILFNGVTLSSDGYYTIGTRNHVVSTLPIELISFDAKLNKSRVDLTWSTASEKNNVLFTVEKGSNGIDFEAIGTVKGAGNSSSRRSYVFTDPDPYNGISYYRLKQTDSDRRSSWSQMVAIDYSDTELKLNIYPNPSRGLIHISSQGFQSGSVKVNITDAEGKNVLSGSFITVKGQQLLTVDTGSDLPPGTYLVKISIGGSDLTQKIIFNHD